MLLYFCVAPVLTFKAGGAVLLLSFQRSKKGLCSRRHLVNAELNIFLIWLWGRNQGGVDGAPPH